MSFAFFFFHSFRSLHLLFQLLLHLHCSFFSSRPLQTKIKEIAAKIELEAQYGNKGLKEALTEFIEKAQNAQRFIQNKGSSEIRRVAAGFINDISALIDQYASHVVREVRLDSLGCTFQVTVTCFFPSPPLPSTG